MQSLHQSAAALRSWPLLTSPNVSRFTLSLEWVGGAPLQPARTLRRYCSYRPRSPLLQIFLAPTTSLSFGRATFHFFFLRTFLHSSISSAFIAFSRFTTPVACPSLSALVAPPSSEKSSCPRRRTSTYSPRRLPHSSAETFAVLLLSCLCTPIESTCALT